MDNCLNKITGVIDYGLGNLYSVMRGLKAAGISAKIVSAKTISKCDYLVLPGVGAFGDGMKKIKLLGILDALNDYVETERPLLGICLGTQLLFTRSNEFGTYNGLNFIQGEVKEIEPCENLAVPHVGWSSLEKNETHDAGLLDGIKQNDEFYFTHSYSCVPACENNILSWFKYGPYKLVAAVINKNVMGCQFHPELSSHPGIKILKQFSEL